MTNSVLFKFNNTYARLPERFFSRISPSPVPKPELIRLNHKLAKQLNLDPVHLCSDEGVQILSGNELPDGAEPLAMAYAGHQFGNWVPQLGDGRAILLGELTDNDGINHDIQLKGSGITPFSRMGDGRAALGPILREFIVSEAMNFLGIKTTRTLAALSTGKQVIREQMLPGAILMRVANSHVRIGTFQYFAARGDFEGVRELANHVIQKLYPNISTKVNPYLSLLEIIIQGQAKLIANWQLIGFIHGVMNTDNMSVAGETIDYGPCAFMDKFHSKTVFSSIDQMGRYAYENQPRIAQWNLACLAETFLPLISDNEQKAVELAQNAINNFIPIFDAEYINLFRKKLGFHEVRDDDLELGHNLLSIMELNNADFTLTFRYLSYLKNVKTDADTRIQNLFEKTSSIDAWLLKWRARLNYESHNEVFRHDSMLSVNPAFIPRNHIIEEVIDNAVNHQNFTLFHDLINTLELPYKDQLEYDYFFQPPRADQIVKETFCGT